MDNLKRIAEEALNTFKVIADAATARLHEKGLSLASLASVNEATAESIARDMRERNVQRISDSMHLRREPTIARLVVSDDGLEETIYISPVGTVDAAGVKSCSYLSPKGRLASLPVGQGDEISLPGGRRWFEVIEKMTFQPGQWAGDWDSQPAIEFHEKASARTIKSLRELLLSRIAPEADVDVVSQWLSEDDEIESGLIVDGIVRETLTAMQLRVKQLLDQFQDSILRLPLDSRIAVLGPPGTGKTTTMIKRLRRTVDIRHLEDDEQQSVLKPDDGGLDHPNSWIMFTPTELLRLYVKDALGKQGVPVHDQRLWVWEDYRLEIAKRNLSILRTATRRGLVPRGDDSILLAGTLTDQIAWFKAFDAFQKDAFVRQMSVEAERLVVSDDARIALIGRQVSAAIERSDDKVLQLIVDLASRISDLREIASGLSKEIQTDLQRPLEIFARSEGFLGALTTFVASLAADAEDEADDDADEDEDEEVEDQRPLTGRRHVVDVFRLAMRARAIGQASSRAPAARTRAGRILDFVTSRGLELPDLKDVGTRLLVQRAARRLARAPHAWLSGVSLRYRHFRRAMRTNGEWYGGSQAGGMDIHPGELDLIVYAILSQAREMSQNGLLLSRLGDNRPALLDAAAELRRNQVLVDEATDFSPLQLAAMRSLASTRTDAVFLAGDFNQRLTLWGSQSEEDLRWAIPNLDVRTISVTYRQSRKLASFATALAQLQGSIVEETAPEDQQNEGFDPILGSGLGDLDALAFWLASRIREIGILTRGAMPTIALLVDDEERLDELAAHLKPHLEDLSMRAVPCPKGLVKGQDGDVRIFDVQHVKGLEFEAVFFVGLDRFSRHKPDLFDRYLYVGATRAATFLGLTISGDELPERIAPLRAKFQDSWPE